LVLRVAPAFRQAHAELKLGATPGFERRLSVPGPNGTVSTGDGRCDRLGAVSGNRASARPTGRGDRFESMNPTAKEFLSQKKIPRRERLIVALDVPSIDEAKQLVERLGDSVLFYKMGLQLFMTGGYFELAEWLHKQNKQIFVDLKFFDVPQTVKNAVKQLTRWNAKFATVHGNDEMLRAAVSEKNGIQILAVTVLTSLDEADMKDLGFQADIRSVVESRAKRALEIGCDGLISSGIEAPVLREKFGDKFLIVTPGIRPGSNRPVDDQKRTVDVEEAFRNGADYIVVGRPILKAEDQKAAAEAIQERIARLFPE
jgi:orotidine-5'-phosphate decarboxylase